METNVVISIYLSIYLLINNNNRLHNFNSFCFSSCHLVNIKNLSSTLNLDLLFMSNLLPYFSIHLKNTYSS